MLVTFSGLDGSGKTTLAREVACRVSRLGMPTTWGTPEYLGGRAVKDFCLEQYGDSHAYATRLSPNVYVISLAVDWARWWLIELKRAPYDRVFCMDRYAIDLAAQALQLGADLSLFEELLRVLPRPDLSYFLDIDVPTASQRIDGRVQQVRHALEADDQLARLRDAFDAVAQSWDWRFEVLDATRPVGDLVDRVAADIIELSQRMNLPYATVSQWS